jgi:hypothetical protein
MQDMAKDLFAGRISKNEHPKSAASTMQKNSSNARWLLEHDKAWLRYEDTGLSEYVSSSTGRCPWRAKVYDRIQMNVFDDIHKGSQMFHANKDLKAYGYLKHF